MFSSNQKFLISGDEESHLKMALKCVLELDNIKPNGYSIDEEKGLILYQYLDDNLQDIFYIPKEEIGNFEYLFNIVRLYLSSKKYSNLLRKTDNEADICDGSSRKGWLIGLCKDLGDYDYHKTIYIKPFWTFYHK
jgi:hypothetical protein